GRRRTGASSPTGSSTRSTCACSSTSASGRNRDRIGAVPDGAAPVPDRTGARSRSSRFTKKLALSCAVLAATLLVAEGLVRARLAWSGTPFDSREAASTFRYRREAGRRFDARIGTKRIANEDGGSVPILHPYIASEDRYDVGGVFEHFQSGLAPGEFTVLVEGG